jgi:hypothetical protein
MAMLFRILLIALSVMLTITSCFPGHALKTTETADIVKGAYRSLLFGCRYPDDILNAAFLDREGDAYSFEIYAPDYEYFITPYLPAEEALAQADRFIRCSFHYQNATLHAIQTRNGSIIGYEMRPLYSPLRFGYADVLTINYRIMDNRIIIYIKLDPGVEAIINEHDREDSK